MLISLAEINELFADFFPRNSKLCINHITVSPDGKLYNILVRNMNTLPWKTLVLIAPTDGSTKPKKLLRQGDYASHYCWSSDTEILFYSDGEKGKGFYKYNVVNMESEKWDEDLFSFDGHMRVSQNGKYMTYDSYPENGFRRLFLFDLIKKRGYEIGKYISPQIDRKIIEGFGTDIRCDLHPRISSDSSFITIDTLNEGYRAIYKIDVPYKYL